MRGWWRTRDCVKTQHFDCLKSVWAVQISVLIQKSVQLYSWCFLCHFKSLKKTITNNGITLSQDTFILPYSCVLYHSTHFKKKKGGAIYEIYSFTLKKTSGNFLGTFSAADWYILAAHASIYSSRTRCVGLKNRLPMKEHVFWPVQQCSSLICYCFWSSVAQLKKIYKAFDSQTVQHIHCCFFCSCWHSQKHRDHHQP